MGRCLWIQRTAARTERETDVRVFGGEIEGAAAAMAAALSAGWLGLSGA